MKIFSNNRWVFRKGWGDEENKQSLLKIRNLSYISNIYNYKKCPE
jgi:hypothetical protein